MEDPDQTARMRSLIRAFAARICPKTRFYRAWLGEVKLLCILCQRGVQLRLAYIWTRLGTRATGKGREGMFLFFFCFVTFFHFLLSTLSLSFFFIIYLFLFPDNITNTNISYTCENMCNNVYKKRHKIYEVIQTTISFVQMIYSYY